MENHQQTATHLPTIGTTTSPVLCSSPPLLFSPPPVFCFQLPVTFFSSSQLRLTRPTGRPARAADRFDADVMTCRGPRHKAENWFPLLVFFPSCVSLHHHNFSLIPLLPSCLFVCVIFRWEVSATAYYPPLTLIGGRGCADWALIAAFPFAFVPSSLPVPWHPLLPLFSHTHTQLQTQPGVHALSPFLSTSNTPQEWALTQLRGFWRWRTPDYSSIS